MTCGESFSMEEGTQEHHYNCTPSSLDSNSLTHDSGVINWSLATVNTTWGNDTSVEENVPVTLLRDIALGTVLGALSLLTFLGNAMVLHAVRTDKRLQTVSLFVILSKKKKTLGAMLKSDMALF